MTFLRGRGAVAASAVISYGVIAFFVSLWINEIFGLTAQLVAIPFFFIGGFLIGTFATLWALR